MPFSFLNAAFLAGAAAAVLPILIHLFSRRKIARIPFSSIQFLEEISRRRVRRMRLTQWIILAMRVLALALLALALGRPAFQGDFALGKSRGESAVAIVFDGSFSMRAEGETRPLWETAVDRVEEVLAAVEPDDTVFLIGVDPDRDEVDAYPTRAGASEAVRVLEPGYGGTDLAAAVRRAGASLADATALNKELFVISDFQRAGAGAGTDLSLADLTADLIEEIRVFLLPVGEGPIANTAIDLARLEGSAVEQRVHVQLTRYAETPVEDLAVTVEAAGEVLGEAVVSVLPGAVQSVDVPLVRLPAAGERLTARIARDRLATDDIYYVPSLGTGSLETWVVQDPAQPSPFLPLALAPGERAGRFDVRSVPPDGLGTADLGNVRLIVLDNVTHLSRESVMRLRQWRNAGGVILVALGDRVDLRYYNETLLPAVFPGVQLGNVLGADEATGSSYTLTPRTPGHQAFSGFEASVGEPLTGASFWRVVEVQSRPGVRTLAEFGPGLPAVVQGDGALLVASSLDGRWNNFPTHAAFLPLLHQSIDAALMEGGEERVRVGEPVEGTVDRSLVPANADLVARGPGALELPVTARSEARGLRLASAPAPEPGFYRIEGNDRVLVRRAVNVDTGESDLTPLNAGELASLFPGDRVRILDASTGVGTPVREARYGREFWRELVVLVLLLMVAEAWLSRRGVA